MSYVRPRALSGVSTRLPTRPVVKAVYLGSLGDEAAPANTLAQPTIPDPAQWQASVLAELRAGVQTLKHAELQKWLQIGATLSIPIAAAVWKAIGRTLGRSGDPTV